MKKIKVKSDSKPMYFGKTVHNGVVVIKARYSYTPAGHINALPYELILQYLGGSY